MIFPPWQAQFLQGKDKSLWFILWVPLVFVLRGNDSEAGAGAP